MGCLVSDREKRWPGRRMPFVINSRKFNSEQRAIIESAIAEFNSNTVMTLVPRNSEPDFVEFVGAEEGCGSQIGRIGGRQTIDCNVGNFNKGVIIHEICHAAGVFHEQSREDRNQFVTINLDNVEEDKKHNFKQHITDGSDIGPYDYGSIMHYGRKAHAADRKIETVSPTNPSDASIGQKIRMSPTDILTIRTLYAAWIISIDGTDSWEHLNSSRVPLEQLRFADFTGSGKSDVFRSNGSQWFISEDGVGSWRQINSLSVPMNQLAFADFTGNGKSDVFRSDGSRWFISEDGVGSWRQINSSSVPMSQLAFADFTGNGKSDVFRSDGTRWFISEDGVGSWRQINSSSVAMSQLAFADFTGSGKSDVFRSDGAAWFISEDGVGSWRQINRSSIPMNQLAFADFTGSGRSDVFRSDGAAWFISEDGVGSWRQINRSSIPMNQLAFADFTGNGKADVFRTGLFG